MEIKDFIMLWTYSQWRQAIVVIPPFSPERETCCILPVNQLSRANFLTKWKKCNIVSLFLQIHIVESTIHRLRQQRPGCQYYWNQRFHNSMDLQPMTTSYCRHSPFLSRKEHRFSCFPLISFRMLALCKKRTFCFIPVICKDCTILSREWHNHSCGLMVCFKAE